MNIQNHPIMLNMPHVEKHQDSTSHTLKKPKSKKPSSIKTASNYITAASTLALLMQSTSRHHIEHAALHSVLGPIVIKAIIEPATKLLNTKMTEPACHSNPMKQKNAENDKKPQNQSLFNSVNDYVQGVYFGMLTHLTTQVLFDEANKLLSKSSHSGCH
jgi:hypothetical protein